MVSDPLAALAHCEGCVVANGWQAERIHECSGVRAAGGLAAYVRDLETANQAANHWFTEANREHNARVRAEGERDERLGQLLYTRDERDANFRLLVEANARNAVLEAALRAYGTHKPTCAVNGDARHSSSAWLVVTNPQPCDCGLDAALPAAAVVGAAG